MSKRFDNSIMSSIVCPVCLGEMSEDADCKTLFCNGTKKHSFDISASGYVNLAGPAQSGGGDSKQAVRARSDFLNTDLYLPISQKLCELLGKYCSKNALVIDAGCGEGYYSVNIAKQGLNTLGFDLSKFAVEAAAKRGRREGVQNSFFGVASVYSLPVADLSADAVVNIFAPCAELEYTRVLKDGGVLIVVGAGEEHLLGLKRVIYDTANKNETRADMPTDLILAEKVNLKYTVKIEGNANIKNLFAMTPYYWKTSRSDAEKLDGTDTLETEIDIDFFVYKK